jgi:hypothetical protein
VQQPFEQKQPDPQPPEIRIEPDPSLRLYLALCVFALILIVPALVANQDWAGLALNLATEIIGAVVILILVDRRLRAEEVKQLRYYTQEMGAFISRLDPRLWFLPRELLLYASVLEKQLTDIEPRYYVSRPQFENLLEKHPNGFILLGMGGSGKSVLMQRTARQQAQMFREKPRRRHVPIFLVAGQWRNGLLRDQMYRVMSSYYPVKKRTFEKWLRRNRVCLILDGVDELLDRDHALREVNELSKRYPRTIIAISSRMEITVDALPKLTLSGFTQEEIARFLKQRGASDKLQESVFRAATQLGTNPLLLEWMARFAETYGEDALFNRMTGNWADFEPVINRSIESALTQIAVQLDTYPDSKEQAHQCLSQLAVEMNNANVTTIPISRLPQNCLSIFDHAVQHGLLSRNENFLQFSHRLILEYFLKHKH